MKLIVAVKSCHRDRAAGFHDAIRETWGQDLALTGLAKVMFFMGEHPEKHKNPSFVFKKDEVVLDCPDDYNGLAHKTRGIAQWAQSKIFNHLFLCDNDTIVNAKALMALPFEPFDYAGHFRGGNAEIGQTFYYKDHMGEYPECHPWASGGIGYFLSKNAVNLVADTFPKVWAEDMYVGQIMGKEIAKGDMFGGNLKMSGLATWHFRKSKMYPEFTPALLRRIHRDGSPETVYEESFHSK